VPKKKSQTKEEKELVKMAAEQFARLFWRHILYKQELKKSKREDHKINKYSPHINKRLS